MLYHLEAKSCNGVDCLSMRLTKVYAKATFALDQACKDPTISSRELSLSC